MAPSGQVRPSYGQKRAGSKDQQHRAPRSAGSAGGNRFSRGKGHAREGDDAPPSKGKDTALSLAGTILTAPPNLALHSNLHKLDLSNCGLTSLAFVREARRTLTWLNVQGNNLRAPEAWAGVNELTGLFVLNASNCQLTEIPSVIEVLHSLKALVFTHNKLKTLDHVKNLAHLNTIVVSNNQLDSLPSALTTLPSLKKVSAAHNRLTVGALPDLTTLSHLREVKLNDNSQLKSLPPHFATWGKQPLPGAEQSKRPAGLEIVDLGNCGFEDWFALKELASQSGIVNLGLKGTKVAEEAKAEGFEDFKSKLTILLPKLRILDGQRFDAKFLDLKARRDTRTPEQRVLDAGPMGLAINAAKEKPVEIPAEMIKERERAKREKELKKKRKYLQEQGGAEVEAEAEERMDVDEVAGEEEKEEPDEEEVARQKAERRAERARKRKTEAEATGEGPSGEGEGKKKKRKNRHDARREQGASGEAIPSSSTSSPTSNKKRSTILAVVDTDPTSTSPSTPTAAAPTDPPPRKRGRVSKDPNRPAPGPRVILETKAEEPRKRREKGSLLAALRGDDSEAAPAAPAPASAPEPTEAPVETVGAPAPSKQKTSVLKVVEVQKKKEKKEKVDVGSLLGLSKPAAAAEATNDESAGLFGAGWD